MTDTFYELYADAFRGGRLVWYKGERVLLLCGITPWLLTSSGCEEDLLWLKYGVFQHE